MHSLAQLRRGELAGITRLDLSEQFDEFPREIFDLADSLEVLNLSGNQLRALPHDLPRLRRLKILFCSDNPFEVLPEVLGDCPQLEMVGFKANHLRDIPEAALPPALRWLILTDNRIENLPDSLGARPRLQKLMLAGNRLSELPESLQDSSHLELLRIAANRFDHLPVWLAELPRLAWLAFAGNPGSDRQEIEALAQHPHAPIPRHAIELGEMLGQGASGIIQRARWMTSDQTPREMAVKLFKGEMTSDGLPHSEMAACLTAGMHPNLIGVAGPLAAQTDTPPGLLLELIAPSYQPLAGPPSLASCTRDIYSPGIRFNADQALTIARGAAAAVAHLHERGILHGDLYAHNLLSNEQGQCLLGDFGAASFFEPQAAFSQSLQRLESRAFGCLLEELQEHCAEPLTTLQQLRDQCLSPRVRQRPLFAEIVEQLR